MSRTSPQPRTPHRRPATRLRRALTAAALGLVTVTHPGVAVAAPDDAPAERVCVDERIEGTRLPGDLVVPAGAECDVRRVAVDGVVRVGTGARLQAWSTTLKQDAVVVGGELELWRSTVWGGVHPAEQAIVRSNDSTVVRSIRGDVRNLELFSTRVQGAINVTPHDTFTTSSLRIAYSQVDGWVNVHGGSIRFEDAALRRALTLDAPSLVRVCDSHVAGDMTVRWAHNVVGIGGTFASPGICTEQGSVQPAPPRNVIGGSLVLVDNPHSVLVRDTTVLGDLVCSGSTGPQGIVVDDATVAVAIAGSRTGQCA